MKNVGVRVIKLPYVRSVVLSSTTTCGSSIASDRHQPAHCIIEPTQPAYTHFKLSNPEPMTNRYVTDGKPLLQGGDTIFAKSTVSGQRIKENEPIYIFKVSVTVSVTPMV